jgi:hypothetical protein
MYVLKPVFSPPAPGRLPAELIPSGRRHELSLEHSDRPCHVFIAHRVLLFRKGSLEGIDIFGHRVQNRGNLCFRRHGHLHRIRDRTLGLRLDIAPGVPELREVGSCVEDRRRVPVAQLPFVTVGCRLVVDTVFVQQMTGAHEIS